MRRLLVWFVTSGLWVGTVRELHNLILSPAFMARSVMVSEQTVQVMVDMMRE